MNVLLFCTKIRFAALIALFALSATTSAIAQEKKPVNQQTEKLHQQADDYFSQGQKFLNLRRFLDAAEMFEKSITAEEASSHPRLEKLALELNEAGYSYHSDGRYDKAESLYQRAVSISEKASGPEDPSVALSLNNLAAIYRTQGRHMKAEPLYQRVLSIVEKARGSDDPLFVLGLNNLAFLYTTQKRFFDAEPLYLRALSIYERVLGPIGPDHVAMANTLRNLAELYNAQGRYAEAEPYYKRALKIYENVLRPDRPEVLASFNALALFYYDQGRYAEAEPLFLRALTVATNVFGPMNPKVGRSLNNLALTYKVQGRYRGAEDCYKQALIINEKSLGPEHPEVAIILNNLASLYQRQQRFIDAEPLLKRALAINEKALGAADPATAQSLNELAELYANQGWEVEVESLLRRSLAIREKAFGGEHLEVANSLHNLAHHYEAQGRYRDAESLSRRALAIVEKKFGPAHPNVVICLKSLAALYEVQSRYAEAEPLFQQALNILRNQIHRNFPFMSEYERDKFYETINYNFEGFNSFVIRRSKDNPLICAEMYNNQLASKALLLNSVNRVRRIILDSGDQALMDAYKKWIAQKEFLARIYTLSNAEIVQQAIDKDSLELAADVTEKQLSHRSQAFTQATDTVSFTWRDIQKTLQPNEAAIEMVRFRWYRKTWTDTVYYAALIVTPETKDHPELVLLKNGNGLEGKFYREYVKCRQSKNSLAYQQYWQPIKEKLKGITKVYFSPDGIYNQMNLNILSNPETGVYVLDEIDIHLVTNTKDLLQFKKKKTMNQQAELFGRPAYQMETQQLLAAAKPFQKHGEESWLSDQERAERGKAAFSDLPGTEKEVNDIGQLLQRHRWQVNVHLGKDALEEAVKAANNPAILHIATHGFFVQSDSTIFRKRGRPVTLIFADESHLSAPNGTNPMLRSGLLLAGAATYLNAEKKPDTEDGILTAYEAANLDLDNTELVVLSACETGLGEVENGEGVYGLQRAFKVSGAKTILMSLWKVDDTATQELMTSFYDTWLKTGNKRQAFRQAQQHIRDKYKLPEYWGAFVMVGE